MEQNSNKQYQKDLALAKEWRQEKQALAAANRLFIELDATEILEELDLIFIGYLSSQFADYQNDRSIRVGTYFSLKSYFTEMQTLQITPKPSLLC